MARTLAEVDDIVARVAAEKEYVTQEKLAAGLEMQERLGEPLGKILLDMKLISEDELSAITSLVERRINDAYPFVALRIKDIRYAAAFIGLKIVPGEKLRALLDLHQKRFTDAKTYVPFHEILVSQGIVNSTDVDRAKQYVKENMLHCLICNAVYAFSVLPEGRRYRCRGCGNLLHSTKEFDTTQILMRHVKEPEPLPQDAVVLKPPTGRAEKKAAPVKSRAPLALIIGVALALIVAIALIFIFVLR